MDLPEHVFITGARGFIGGALAARLARQGVDVAGVDLEADPGRRIVSGDTATAGAWQERSGLTNVVVHAAAIVSNAIGLDEQRRVNVLGTRRALDAAIRKGATRFVHISSVRAFGDDGFPDRVTEDHPVRPNRDPYVMTKIASEQVVLAAHCRREIECVVIRPGDVYGPGSRPWTLLPVEAIKARRLILPAMGRGIFSPTYVDNLLDGLELAMTHRVAAGEIFTVSDGEGVSCREFFGHYSRMLGRRRPPCVPTSAALTLAAANEIIARSRGESTEANRTTVRYLTRAGTYSIGKARSLLGYSPQIELTAGMEMTERWLREQALL